MKQIKDVISAPLAKLTNRSFHNGVFPNILKIAKVIPIFKSKSRVACNSYRPISLLSNIEKIIEKLMHKRLHSFLETQNCFYPAQFGFRLNVSTNNALMSITENIQTQLDEGKYCAGVFVDLKKAFDTVNHKILQRKLDYYGIRGIANEWLCSYLKKRKQFVSIENNVSSVKEILTGVTQGSALGPLLFLIYIYDLHQSIRFSKTCHFADDASIIQSNPSLERLSKQVSKDLSNLSNWLRTNKLSLIVKKTELVIFRPRKLKIDHNFKFRLDGKRLVPAHSVKYLGVDEHLLWNKQIAHIKMRLNRAIGILSKLQINANVNILKTAYYSLFEQLWAKNNETITTFQKLQNRALRKINFKKRIDRISCVYKEYKILKFPNILNLQNCLFMYQIQHRPKLSASFPALHAKDKHNYSTRSATHSLLDIPLTKTNRYGKNSVKNYCIRD